MERKSTITILILLPFFCLGQNPYKILKGHKHKVNNLSFSNDCKYLISSSWDNTVRVWNMDTFDSTMVLTGHKDNVWGCTINSNNSLIASASMDRSVIIWNFNTGEIEKRIKIEPHDIIVKGEIPELNHKFPNSVYSVSFSPNNQILAIGCADHLIRIYNLKSFKLIDTLNLHDNWILGVKFSEDGKYLVSGAFRSEIIIWETETFKPIRVIKDKDGFNGAFLLFDNNEKLLTAGNSEIIIWSVKTGKVIRKIPVQSSLQSVQLTSNLKYLVTCAEDHTVRIWKFDTGEEIWKYTNPKPEISSCRISPNGQYLAVATPESNILIWKIEDILKK